jgi:hypothetical protein
VKRGFEVTTSNIIAGVKGTLFAVLHRKAERFTRVAVYSGIVLVSDIMRKPDTAAELNKGKVVDIIQDRFGDIYTFKPWSAWDHWEKEPNPSTEFLGRTAPSAVTSFKLNAFQRDPGDDDYDEEYCPPVIDNDGNVIIQ